MQQKELGKYDKKKMAPNILRVSTKFLLESEKEK